MRSYKKKKGGNNTSRKKRHFYNMKGCSNSRCLGGGGSLDLSKVYPNPGKDGGQINWINSSVMRGGCGCMQQNGGRRYKRQRGGNNGLPYGQNLPFMKNPVVPNGLTGSPWKADFKWPGVNGVSGDYNHYSLNKYIPDVVTAIKNVGANFPFLNGGGSTRKRKGKKMYKKRGGGISNSLGQDLINGIRGAGYSADKFASGLRGINPGDNPLPYKQEALLNGKYN
jgi:hypothetical protein